MPKTVAGHVSASAGTQTPPLNQNYPRHMLCLIPTRNLKERLKDVLLVLPVKVAPLSTQVLDAGYGVLHQLRAT